MVKKMDDPNMSGRQTPGIGTGSKPPTPGPNQSAPNSMGSNAASHGAAMRYGGYGSPMHPAYGPQGMMPQGGPPPGAHPGMAPHHNPYGQAGAYGGGGGHPGSHQMQQPPQQPHSGQYHGMPMSPMMPPPSQYPNKAQAAPQQTAPPGQPTAPAAGMNPSASPSPHSAQQQQLSQQALPHMMSSDRSAMSYYGQQRFAGPPQPSQSPSAGPHQPPPNAYYMRPPMGGPHGGGKNSGYYGPNGPQPPPPHGGYGGGPDMRMSLQQQQHHQQQQQQHHQQMMMSGQHPSHHQHQMMMHHHQMQQQAGYGLMGHMMGGESGREPTPSSTPSSVTSAPANSSSEGHRHPQPPPIIDEVSQTSTASSQAAEDSCASADMTMGSGSHKGGSKHHLSHPSTPNTSNLGSPGAASMSSFHDDFDSVSSPSWPRTPASPALNSSQFSTESHHHSSSKRNDGIQKLYEISDEPERRAFLDKYLQFQEERGQPLTQVPTISKIPLDLYRLYLCVRERGGFSEVTKGKLWKECGQICNIANSSSAAYTLRKQYMKHMLHFECKFDRGGIDPAPVILQLDAATNSKKKTAAMKASAAAAAAAAANASTTSAPSTSAGSQSRLSPSGQEHQSAPSGVPSYAGHHPHHSMGPYDMEGQGGFAPPNTSVSAASGQMPPYGQMAPGGPHHATSGPYGHPQQQPPHATAPGDYPHYLPAHSAGHMPPPAPPPTSATASGGQPPTSSSTPHNENISVKDPFADEDMQAAAAAAAAAASGSSPNYPPSRQPHYAMHPGSQGPYYNPHGQTHSGYPESGHPPHGHYPVEGAAASGGNAAYGRPPPAVLPESSATHPHQHAHPHYAPAGGSAAVPGAAYQPRMPANGHPSHGYYAGGGAQPQTQPPQPIPYESPHSHQRPPFSESPHHTVGRPPMAPSPHEHYSGHPNQPPHSGSMHRYPNSPMGFGPRGPYNSAQPPHPSQAQQPGPPYSSSADTFSKGADPYNQSGPRMQSPLAQRLLAAKESSNSASQAYPMNQSYPNAARSSSPMQPSPSSKGQSASGGHHHGGPNSSAYQPMQQQANSNISWMPTSRYGAPKRHPDFAKPSAEQQHANFGQSQQPPPSASSPAGAGQPYQQAYPGGSYPAGGQKQNSGHPSWSRAAEQGSVQYRMGTPGHPYHPQHLAPGYGPGGSRAEQQWHEGRSPSASGPPSSAEAGHHHPSLPAGEGGRPPNWPHSGRFASADYRSAAMHEQFNAGGHPKMMASGHPFSHGRGGPPGEAMSGGAAGSGYLMHHHPSPGKLALSNQLAERRGIFQHSAGPPLFAAAAGQHTPGPHPQAIMKRDIIFPPGTVEATVPTPTKQRRITSREFTSLGPIDAWRLFMSLKSGLLAESTYALDVLNVYSNDDNSLSYLALNNMPGLLEVLLEHYKCYLNEMFDHLFEDTEIGFEARQLRYELNNVTGKYCPKKEKTKESQTGVKRKLKWYELARDYEEEEEQSDEKSSDEEDEEDEMGLFLDKHFKSSKSQQVVLTNTTNYTHVTRSGLPVKFKRAKSLFISDYEKSWDQIKNGFAIGHEHWVKGGGETTSHIVSHFEPKESRLRFVRTIKGSQTAKTPEMNGDSAEEGMEIENDEPLSDETACSTAATNGDQHYPKIRDCDQARYLKSRYPPPFEEESYELEESPIVNGGDYHESIKARVLTVSNLIRNLTFVPGNDLEMCKHSGLLLVLSRLILLQHTHAVRKRHSKAMDLAAIRAMDEETLAELNSQPSGGQQQQQQQPLSASGEGETMFETEWFSDALHLLRENTLVTLANLSCHLKLAPFPESISLHILDGILHWATCPSSYAQDSLPSAHYSLSPRRLALETLTKLSIVEANVDLILATPPWDRLETLLANLVRSLGRQEEQTVREFSVVLLSNLSSEPSAVRTMVALRCPSSAAHTGGTTNILSLLIGFIEQAEASAMHVASTHSLQVLRETAPDLAMGTTVDMIRRAAATLRHISRSTDNRPLFIQYEARLLSLAMSPILDSSVAVIIADILYESSFVSAKKQLLAAEARLAAEQADNCGATPTPSADNSTGTSNCSATAANDDSFSASGQLDAKNAGSESTSANTAQQLNEQNERMEATETIKTSNEIVSAEATSKKVVKNGIASPSDESISKLSTPENFEKVNNQRSDSPKEIDSSNVNQSESVDKPTKTSNGFEHKSPVNTSSKTQLDHTKSEFNNSNNNSVGRVSNGMPANSVYNSDKDSNSAADICLESQKSTIYDTHSGYPNTLPSVDFFKNCKGGLPHGPLLMGNDAMKGTNYVNYYHSTFPNSREHLLPSSKSLASNGLLDAEDETAVGAANSAVTSKKSTASSVASAAASDLNSTVGGVGATAAVVGAAAPPTAAAAIIEASSI